MNLKFLELYVSLCSQYGEYLILLNKDLSGPFPKYTILRFPPNKRGHIRTIMYYNESYSAITNRFIVEEFVRLLFTKQVENYVNKQEIKSTDPDERRKEIFDILFYNWK